MSSAADPLLGGARILVVDDEPAVRRYVRRVLEAEGYDVVEAGDGDEASELLNAHPQRWDLVVSDIVMPRCNGVELHRRISDLAPGCAVILMSAYGIRAAHRAGYHRAVRRAGEAVRRRAAA